MKKLLLILCLFAAAGASAQKDTTKKPSIPQSKEQPTAIALTDSTAFLDIRTLVRLSDGLKDRFSARQYEIYMAGLDAVIKEAVAEWNRKNKKGGEK
jgi:hypothetical protein